MVLTRLLTAALLLAALALPATAGAAQRASDSSRPAARSDASRAKAVTPLAAAAAAGRSFWGAAPCQGQVRVLAQRPLPAGIDPGSDAWVTFDSPLGANNLAAPAGSYTNCTISFASRRWPTSASMREDWDILCSTMTHELGHLLGHSHDSTSGNIMVPVFTDYSSVTPQCRKARPDRQARSARSAR